MGDQKRFKIVYETTHYLIVDKDSGLLVHGDTHTSREETLIEKLRREYGLEVRLVNRLDRDTSGLLLVAKSKLDFLVLKSLFLENKIDKKYLAILSRPLPSERVKINFSIGRDRGKKLRFSVNNSRKYKSALTYAETIDSNLVLLSLKTGRTHQLRAHLYSLSCPILNDPIYGHTHDKEDSFGQYLHSFSLCFIDPWSESTVSVYSSPPLEFARKLSTFNIDSASFFSFSPTPIPPE